MKNRALKRVAAAVAVALFVNSCATLPPPGTALTPQQRKEAQTNCIAQYALAGALGGAILGQVVGGDTRSTLKGAAVGGVLAAALAWGHCLSYYSDLASFPIADARQTATQLGWQPAQGNQLRIQSFAVTPRELKPGGGVTLTGSYALLSASGAGDVKVTETRSVSYFDPATNAWKDLGAIDQQITAALGTRRAEGHFDLPGDVPAGRYRITFKVSALGKVDQQTQEITVRGA